MIFTSLISFLFPLVFFSSNHLPSQYVEKPLAVHEMSMDQRYGNQFVNDVFKDNILLTLAYTNGKVSANNVKWDGVLKPFTFELKLKPGQVFAFHSDVLAKYQNEVAKTTNANFNFEDGFKSDGYLTGDGVCHLASIINWVASDAGLQVEAPTNHNFAVIPQVPQKFGTSIYYYPGQHDTNALNNLYVRNNKNKDIFFKFDYDGKDLKVSVLEQDKLQNFN
jgi:hypothetical protein